MAYTQYICILEKQAHKRRSREDYPQYLDVTKRKGAPSGWMGSDAQPFSDLSREVCVLEGPINDFHRVVLKPFL